MSSPGSNAFGGRPRPVLVGVALALVGSVLLVVSLFDTMGATHSAAMHDSLRDFLAKPPGSGLGLSVNQALHLLRVLVLVDGGLAAAAAIFAGYAFLRHRGAWWGLSVCSVLLLVTGSLSGSPFPLLVLGGVALLWSRPARDWFAGRAPAPAQASGQPGQPRQPGQVGQPGPESLEPSPPDDAAAPAVSGAPPAVDPRWAPPALVGPPRNPSRRPAAVVAAVLITWVFAGLTVLFFLFVVGVLLFDKQLFIEAAQRSPGYDRLSFTADQMVAALWAASAVMIGWALAAMTCAFFVVRRFRWARPALAVSAAIAIPMSLLVFPFGLLNVVAEAATLVLLFGGRANSWFASDHPARSTYPGGPAPERKPPSNVW